VVAEPETVAEPESPEPVTVVVTVAEPPAEPVVVVVVTVAEPAIAADPDMSPAAEPAVSSAFFFLQPANANTETRAASRMNFFMGNLLASTVTGTPAAAQVRAPKGILTFSVHLYPNDDELQHVPGNIDCNLLGEENFQ